MRWIDYRESLGIGFSDDERFRFLLNRVRNYFNSNSGWDFFSESEIFNFCNEIGYDFNFISDDSGQYDLSDLVDVFDSHDYSFKEFIACYCSLINNTKDGNRLKQYLISFIKQHLEECDIGYEVLNDNQQFFIYPIGVKLFDEKLVFDVLSWLNQYPKTYTTYKIALEQYNNKQYIRDIADNLRKSIEVFFQEFLGNTKNLDNNISEIGTFLKSNKASDELRNMLTFFLRSFKTENDKIAKHHDNVDPKYLEFLLYQTGIFIRMLITVRNNI